MMTGHARLTELNEAGRVTLESACHVAGDVTLSTMTDVETFWCEVFYHFPDVDPSGRYLVEFWTERDTEPQTWDRYITTDHPGILSQWSHEKWKRGEYEAGG